MDSAIMSAEDQKLYFSQDENERDLYRRRFKATMDYNSGMNNARREGLRTGEEKKAKEIACKLKTMGTTKEQIAEITGLSQIEIENI